MVINGVVIIIVDELVDHDQCIVSLFVASYIRNCDRRRRAKQLRHKDGLAILELFEIIYTLQILTVTHCKSFTCSCMQFLINAITHDVATLEPCPVQITNKCFTESTTMHLASKIIRIAAHRVMRSK